MRIAFPVPSWLTLPYIPERTYATASPIAMRIPSNFCAPFLSRRVKYGSRENHQIQNKQVLNDIQLIKGWIGPMQIKVKLEIILFNNTYSRARSSLTLLSTSIIFDPTRSCITIPDVTIGVIPSSITVPRFDARITRIQ